MSENYIGIRFTNPKRLQDNAILSAAEAAAVKELVATNVLLYGAVADDLTDNTNAFNAALTDAALPSNSCVVFVPKGTYLISGTLAIPANVELVGECRNGSTLHFTGSAVDYDCITMTHNTTLSNIRTTYTGSNSTTSTAVSIIGNTVFINRCNINNTFLNTPDIAFGIGFDAATNFTSIYDNTVHGVVNAIRWTGAGLFARIINCLLNVGTAGTVIDFTNSSTRNGVFQCILRGISGACTGINTGAASIVAMGNSYSVTTPVTGAGLLTSTIVDNATNVNFNTTANYAVDGVQVVTNRQTGWNTTTTGATPASVVPASASVGYVQAEATATMQVVNALKAAMITHGLIGT